MNRALVYAMALIGAAAFLFMVKLMHDMTAHMARMTDQVAVMSTDMSRMRAQMETLTGQITVIAGAVEHMGPLAKDVQGIRAGVEAMAGLFGGGGEQLQRLNPMEMMEQMLPGNRSQ